VRDGSVSVIVRSSIETAGPIELLFATEATCLTFVFKETRVSPKQGFF